MASKVFISWGGNLSKRLAEEIKNGFLVSYNL